MTPYETDKTVTTTADNQIVAMDLPGRCMIDRVAIVRIGGGAISATFYNRAFAGPLITVFLIANANGKCGLVLSTPAAFAVGDATTVAGSPTSGYNTTHRIIQRIDDQHYVTDQAYSADATDGPAGTQTVTLAIPSAEWPLYQAIDVETGTDNLQDWVEETYINRDPLLNLNIGVKRKIYVLLANAGTYRISLRTTNSIGITA